MDWLISHVALSVRTTSYPSAASAMDGHLSQEAAEEDVDVDEGEEEGEDVAEAKITIPL